MGPDQSSFRLAGTISVPALYREVGGGTLEDGELVEQAKSGDVGAYERLVERYQDIAFRTAWMITGESEEAKDAAQEAFVKAYYALVRLRPGVPFRPWLLRIAANEAHNRRKAAARRTQLAIRAETQWGASGEPSAEAAALAREQRDALIERVNGLRHDDRLAIACRYFLDLSEEEMAAALRCARGTVKSRLSRALGRLRESMAQEPSVARVQELGTRTE